MSSKLESDVCCHLQAAPLLRATKVNAGLAESNGRLLLGIWRDSLHVTCGLTACTPGSAPGPTLGNEYGKTLLLPLPWHTDIERKGSGGHTSIGTNFTDLKLNFRERKFPPLIQYHLLLLEFSASTLVLKIQTGFTFLVLAYPGSSGKEAVKWV